MGIDHIKKIRKDLYLIHERDVDSSDFYHFYHKFPAKLSDLFVKYRPILNRLAKYDRGD